MVVCLYVHTPKYINIYVCEKPYSAEINGHIPFSFNRLMVWIYVHFTASFCMIYKLWAIYIMQLFNLPDCFSILRKVINFSRMKYIIW